MLTEIYIEALLVDEELAVQVWEAWEGGLIPDELVAMAWRLIQASAKWPGDIDDIVARQGHL